MKYVMFVIFILSSSLAFSEQPTCHTYSGGNYCKYAGPVEKIYVNEGGLILIYFDVPIDIGAANSLGMNISNNAAASLMLSENPDYAKLLYSTALAAQASGRDIVIQMREQLAGYPKVDRIWLVKQ